MSLNLRKRKNKDGTVSLVIDIYHAGKRSYEFLKHLQLPAGSSPVDRQTRKENLDLAKKIILARAQEISSSDYNVVNDHSKKVIVIDWMNEYAKNYCSKDIRVVEGVIKRFDSFLKDRKMSSLTMKDFNEATVEDFKETLKACKGEGARSYYGRLRKIVKRAYRNGLLSKNPCEFVAPPKGDANEKETLTIEELQLLAQTMTDAVEVKRAFLFCSVTGLRFCEVKELTWNDINLKEKILKVKQSKTGKIKRIPLGEDGINQLGENSGKAQYVFSLPTAEGSNKSLKALVTRAGINKKITWHCARHSFGTNLRTYGAEGFTIMNLLGHTTMKHTQRYTRASNELNQKAVNNLPKIGG